MASNMKPATELYLGFRDAENYRRNENKDLFSRIFLQTPDLNRLVDPNTYFLVGEKGTGKTAYAVFLSNMDYKNTDATLRYIRETEYRKFVAMRKEKQLSLSDYTNIWKVIIYLLLSQQIKDRAGYNFVERFLKFDKLSRAIDDFYQRAFAPEIIYAIQFAEEANLAAELIATYAKVGVNESASVAFSESRFQLNLLYIQQRFEKALESLKLETNHILFIDGIDIRPATVDYRDYLDCIRGLANAVWAVNNDFFGQIKDSKGRMKVVLLVRPDIFNSLGLQNTNSKILDNSVVLNWTTTYTEYRDSPIFRMTERLLNYEQTTANFPGDTWAHYFPYDAPRVRSWQRSPSSFIMFMRYSLFRPRDILTILQIQQENLKNSNRGKYAVFELDDFYQPAFTRKYSDYILGEVKDHLAFYYSDDTFNYVIRFFQYMDGASSFNYEGYLAGFRNFLTYLEKNKVNIPEFCETPDRFLQVLYDLNVIMYIVETDREPFFGWCYRERSPSNLAPKVRTHVRYQVHYGLAKALDLGKRFDIDYDAV